MNKSTKITAAPETVDPRERMKEIRSKVKMYLDGDYSSGFLNHLGELPDNMDDARRVIIALQDLLEVRIQRHNKASNNIRDLMQDADDAEDFYTDLIVEQGESIQDLLLTNLELNNQIGSLDQYISEVDKRNETLKGDSDFFLKKYVESEEKVKTLTKTLKILMEN